MIEASPFLPGTHKQVAWDSTSLGWLKECNRKYFYHMIEGWTSRSESVHLRWGILYHSALEGFDRLLAEGQSREDALRAIVRQALIDTWDRRPDAIDLGNGTDGAPWVPDHNLKTRENLIRSIIWYIDNFADDAAETVTLANGKPAVELSFRFEVRPGLILCGHLDRVVSYQGGYYVMDRKTTTTTPGSYYFDQYEPDNQMSLYTLAGRVVYNTPVSGVIIDAAQVAVGFTRFVRGLTYRTESQLEEWLDDTEFYVAQAHQMAEANYWPMNDKSCHKYGGCAFQRICSRDPSVRESFLQSDFVRKEWNPLRVR